MSLSLSLSLDSIMQPGCQCSLAHVQRFCEGIDEKLFYVCSVGIFSQKKKRKGLEIPTIV
jgi:hypothetical protein